MSSDVRQMSALQAASIRSPSKRRLPRIAALVPFLPQATCRFWLCWTGFSSRCRTSAIGRPICRRNRAGARVVTIRVDTPSVDTFSECVLHSRRHVDDVTLLHFRYLWRPLRLAHLNRADPGCGLRALHRRLAVTRLARRAAHSSGCASAHVSETHEREPILRHPNSSRLRLAWSQLVDQMKMPTAPGSIVRYPRIRNFVRDVSRSRATTSSA